LVNEQLDKAFECWIGSERRGEDAEAERALAGVFALLPPPSGPSGGFSARVMASLPHLYQRNPWERLAWGWRAALAVALTLTGLATIFAPSVLPALSWLFRPQVLVSAAAGITGSLARAFIEAVAVGKAWLDVVTVLWSLISLPSLWGAWFVAAATSLAAFRWLLDQSSKRSGGHASSR